VCQENKICKSFKKRDLTTRQSRLSRLMRSISSIASTSTARLSMVEAIGRGLTRPSRTVDSTSLARLKKRWPYWASSESYRRLGPHPAEDLASRSNEPHATKFCDLLLNLVEWPLQCFAAALFSNWPNQRNPAPSASGSLFWFDSSSGRCGL